MRAVIVNDYGQTPVLGEVPTPRPGPRQLLIRLRTAAVNPVDRRLAHGDRRIMFPGTFPMVLGTDGAGIVESVGEGTTRFAPGDVVFGQLMIPPIGSTGTYAEYVAVDEDAPLTRVPDAMDLDVAAALPTIGMTGLAVTAMLAPLEGRTVLIVGARGGVGSMATQFAARAGAHVTAVAPDIAAERMRRYGAAEIIGPTALAVPEAVQRAHPDGIDALIDLVSDADRFASLAKLVRPGGSAVTTRFVADVGALEAVGVTEINFVLSASDRLLDRVAEAVVTGHVAPPPITRVPLEEAPAVVNGTVRGASEVKTVITVRTGIGGARTRRAR
ncbi:NADP-dependent oxidoreductase [Streptomyces sp. NPDC006602]|uniref:NADP-dependent oxidoreductase n=1 Tax=Streptomyces sp. NPDC006602 TaxID=3364751 RepID=UPI0036B4CCCA